MELNLKKQHIGLFVEQRGGVFHSTGLELVGKARELVDISRKTGQNFSGVYRRIEKA